MKILTEPIGSVPRPKYLVDALGAFAQQQIDETELSKLFDEALKDTIKRFEETGSPVITDGEQTKPSFATYPIHGLKTLAPDGVVIPFADGHTSNYQKLQPVRFIIKPTPAAILQKQNNLQAYPLSRPYFSLCHKSLIPCGRRCRLFTRAIHCRSFE